jgi:enoyl-CoA hydratase/carnithine racemase
MTDDRTYTRVETAEVDGIATLTLASDKVNALDVETLGEISAYVDACASDPGVRALVVTGRGSIFSAGLNVSEVLDNPGERTAVLLGALNRALVGLFSFPKPTVAALNGAAIAGGCILACACDRRLLVDGARIGATELKVGVSFPVFAVELLRHACGAAAEQLAFDAALLDGDEAVRAGLAHRIVAADVLLAEATSQAVELTRLDARAYALTKTAARRSALAVVDDEACRALDAEVLAHWQEDATRARLEQLRKPRG